MSRNINTMVPGTFSSFQPSAGGPELRIGPSEIRSYW